jgi:gamma-glutamyltranspeptidase/glutathione hydrolase
MATGGMAATSHPLATQIAVQVLRQGGSAVDAAIAANASLGLMEPTGAGVGGDLFAIVWDAAQRQLRGLNASGRSPRSLTLEQLQAMGLERVPAYGPLSVSVPGAVDGWIELHTAFGKLEFSEVLAPAIEYAERGFAVTEVIAGEWAASATLLEEFPGYAEVFMPDGRAPAAGDVFSMPKSSCRMDGRPLRGMSSGIRDSRRLIVRSWSPDARLSTKAISHGRSRIICAHTAAIWARKTSRNIVRSG